LINLLKKILSPILIVFLIALSTLSMQSTASAEQSHPDISNKVEVEKYFDEHLAKLLKKYPVPGGVVSVVRDGKVYFAKGFGYQDPGKTKPVNNDSVFRIGSVTKSFTATAIMQLVEQGKLDLNADINKYLKGFKVVGKGGKKVTIHNLLTHTAGFDESLDHFITGKNHIPLDVVVKKYMPKMIVEPGVEPIYSNYGFGLLGYIVQEVSGQPYEEYIQQHVFDPLDMKDTTLLVPKDHVKSYDVKNGKYINMKATDLNLRPAGTIWSTASDMANYMMGQLQTGKYKGAIVKDETSTEMQTPHFTVHTGVAGFGYNYYQDMLWKNHQPVQHGGSAEGFKAHIYLIPDLKFGVFMSTNSTQGRLLFTEFFDQFHKDFFPQSFENKVSEKLTSKKDLEKTIAGSYVANRYVHHGRGKLLQLLNLPETKINAVGNGIIEIATPDGHKKVFIEKEKNLFAEENGPDTMAFYKTPAGDTHFAISSLPISYGKVSGMQHASSKMILFLVLVVPTILAIFFYPIGWLIRKILKKSSDPKVTKFRRISWLSVTLNTIYLVYAFFVQEAAYSQDTPSLAIPSIIAIVALLLNLWLIPQLSSILKAKLISKWATFVFIFMIVFGLIFTANMMYWNLLGLFF